MINANRKLGKTLKSTESYATHSALHSRGMGKWAATENSPISCLTTTNHAKSEKKKQKKKMQPKTDPPARRSPKEHKQLKLIKLI